MNWDDCGPLVDVPVNPDETLSRYMLSGELRADNSVKTAALMPFLTRHYQ